MTKRVPRSIGVIVAVVVVGGSITLALLLDVNFIGIGIASGVIIGIGTVMYIIGNRQRVSVIESKRELWGDDVCDQLLKRRIDIGMEPTMVRLAWGLPENFEDIEATANGGMVRWKYRMPSGDINYVWFEEGKVTKIQGNQQL